jgi:hypothetical protein
MERIEIYTSKKKSVFMLLGSLVFVALGIWMFMNADNFTGWRGSNPMITQGIGGAAVLFFGFGVFTGIKRLIRSQLVLIIDPKGLSFNPEKSPEVIEWKDILGFEEIKIHGQRIIIIGVTDPDYWIEKETSAFRRKLMQFNLNSYGSPFNIAAAGYDISYEELNEKLDYYFEKYRSEVQQGV